MRWAGTLAAYLAPLPGRGVVSGLGLACILIVGLPGCLVDLPATCGDGHVDLTEDCDPAAVGPNNGASCDPVTCTPISELGCGNGVLDAGEQCDGVVSDKTCPSGKGFLSCTSDCKLDESTCDPCGNGVVEPDAGEECEQKGGVLTQPVLCSELTAFPTKPYTSGQVMQCTDQCLWYRGPCGYCGDGEVDDPQLVDVDYPDTKSKWELCDGENLRSTDLHAYCDEHCPFPDLLCTPRCTANCQAFEAVPDDELRCCLPVRADCPTQASPVPCCAGFAPGITDPYDPLTACELRFTTDEMGQPVQKNVCR